MTLVRPTLLIAALILAANSAFANPTAWRAEWPRTDFTSSSVDFDTILSGGPPKDGIPSIDNPEFVPVAQANFMEPTEPVLSLNHNGVARAYPVHILMWHEIVNDMVGGEPIAVTYCPLCNSGIAFRATIDGEATQFGTTGKLRNSDLVMYDRASESWWQQFTGEAIVGTLTGRKLETIPLRMEALSAFAARHPTGEVLARPNVSRRYGANPYVRYDTSRRPFLYDGTYDGPVPALTYVVQVGETAWPLPRIRDEGTIEEEGLTLTFIDGMAAPLDAPTVAGGRTIGTVSITRDGEEVPFHMPFAFAFMAFHPKGEIKAGAN